MSLIMVWSDSSFPKKKKKKMMSQTPGYISVTLICDPLIKSTFTSWACSCEDMSQLKARCEDRVHILCKVHLRHIDFSHQCHCTVLACKIKKIIKGIPSSLTYCICSVQLTRAANLKHHLTWMWGPLTCLHWATPSCTRAKMDSF